MPAQGRVAAAPASAEQGADQSIFLPLTSTDASNPAATTVETTSRLYWGAMVDGQAPSPERLALFAEFETQAGKQMSILHWDSPWKMNGKFMPFQTSYFNNVRSRGSIPMLDWGSWEVGLGKTQPAFRLSKITNGTYDA